MNWEFIQFWCMIKHTITKLVISTGIIQGTSNTIFKLHIKPINFDIVRTVFSLPTPLFYSTKANFQLFQKHCKIHIPHINIT